MASPVASGARTEEPTTCLSSGPTGGNVSQVNAPLSPPPLPPQRGSSPRTPRRGLSTQQQAGSRVCGKATRPSGRFGPSPSRWRRPETNPCPFRGASQHLKIWTDRCHVADFTLVLLGINALFFFFNTCIFKAWFTVFPSYSMLKMLRGRKTKKIEKANLAMGRWGGLDLVFSPWLPGRQLHSETGCWKPLG